MKSEKAVALESNGSNMRTNNGSTMHNHTPTKNKFQYNSRLPRNASVVSFDVCISDNINQLGFQTVRLQCPSLCFDLIG